MEVLRIAVPNSRMSEKMLNLLERAGLNLRDKKKEAFLPQPKTGAIQLYFYVQKISQNLSRMVRQISVLPVLTSLKKQEVKLIKFWI